MLISIIIPTYNESKNIPELVSKIDQAMYRADITDYEVLVMDDDSPDGTSKIVNDLGMKRIKSINRKGKPRGLAHAVFDGFKNSKGDVFCVMDADLSHPPSLLPEMAKAIQAGANLAVGSRYVKGGGCEGWPWMRRLSSLAACTVARLVTPIKDSTSGFFMIRKKCLENITLDPQGFKIGLEIFVKANHEGNYTEVPYVFKDRKHGESKLSGQVIMEYFNQVQKLMKAQKE